ncbi:glutathione transferase GstA [Microvirga tunisiensis]|uniref:Glutathione transferase GstA n=2 Tax=Pannonibacter tanglangensis TaxID=2750084 RepID=A0ABW9ZCM8_9HYPH|nr:MULTISPECIES: glutathione transferase GstA [unclassified Pannonibacter]NBN62592.1 glutathione transferase GstA [Pannonibacter sp. XCT-34]NBN78247.1 glutathione transferase GstA [Pannonibacter sp. XCT-53]
MKLYFSPGACSLATHIVLRELGLGFDTERVDTKTKVTASGANFYDVNPDGYVPALQLGNGEVLTEGAAILQYLADQHPQANLAPAPGTWERTQLHRQLNFIAAELHKSFSPLFRGAEGEARKAAIDTLGVKFAHFDRLFADGRPYVLGDTFSVADAYLFTVLGWTRFVQVDLSAWPVLVAYMERIAARKAVQDALVAEGLVAA